MSSGGHDVYTDLISKDFALCIIFKVAVPLKSSLHDLPELGHKRVMVEQVMDAQARPRRLAGIRRADSLLDGPDAE